MTNGWTDLQNGTCFIAWGANPVENHPASIAHINAARAKGAKLVVVDPRKTRTALQADQYIRIRPGTDIALANGIVREIIRQMEAAPTSAVGTKFFAYLNASANGSFFNDGAAAKTAVVDQAIVLNGTTTTLPAPTPTALGNPGISGVVVKSQDGTITYTATTATVNADYTVDSGNGTITRTNGTTTIPDGATVLVSYNYGGSGLMTNVAGSSKYTDARFVVKADATDYDRITLNSGSSKQISNFTKKCATIYGDLDGLGNVIPEPNTVFNRLKAHVAPYTLAVTSQIVGCSESEILDLVKYFIDHSRCSSVANPVNTAQDPTAAGYRALTLLYAMGITQHTCGGQNVKSFAVLQTLMGNMGRAGGGINALRGIHNVQGSTDMGLLYGNIPAYSGNPTVQYGAVEAPAVGSTPATSPNAFGKYMDALWGTPLSGSGNKAVMDGSYADAYNTAAMALQQRGFYNMTVKWFGDPTVAAPTRAQVDAWYALWPKGNGDDHITMFRKMGAHTTKAAVVWGQNPAVTEPNQGAVREGLRRLDLLVVVDMFETETAACDRKEANEYGTEAAGVTYLIPVASHPEKAGSVTNSGRTLQWRYEARKPAGNTREDTELLLRFAKALDTAGAFSHIAAVSGANVYDRLYKTPYGGFDPGVNEYATLAPSGTSDVEFATMRTTKDVANSYLTGSTTPAKSASGSEYVNELIFREMCAPSGSGGTIWIYTGAYNGGAAWTTDNKAANQDAWEVHNRAKSRNNKNDSNNNQYHGWGYSWLVNRRVLYNNGEVPGDVADYFMGPDSCSRLFVSTTSAVLNYSRWYRTVHKLADRPDVTIEKYGTPEVTNAAFNAASPHFQGTVTFAGRFPAHTEPYETRYTDLAATWGRNTKGTKPWDLVKDDTDVAGRDVPVGNYPLILTTIRCVEHFQGGPITRNNSYNVEAEPVPWIELNSADARLYGIKDGEWVKIVTPRTEGFTDDSLESEFSRALYGQGFKARVGVGADTNQRVGRGVVAIPWHWGDRGLSTGSRANDLCIDAGDANTMIPEYKACLCRIEPM